MFIPKNVMIPNKQEMSLLLMEILLFPLKCLDNNLSMVMKEFTDRVKNGEGGRRFE